MDERLVFGIRCGRARGRMTCDGTYCSTKAVDVGGGERMTFEISERWNHQPDEAGPAHESLRTRKDGVQAAVTESNGRMARFLSRKCGMD